MPFSGAVATNPHGPPLPPADSAAPVPAPTSSSSSSLSATAATTSPHATTTSPDVSTPHSRMAKPHATAADASAAETAARYSPAALWRRASRYVRATPIFQFYSYLYHRRPRLLLASILVNYALPIAMEALPWFLSLRKLASALRSTRNALQHDVVAARPLSQTAMAAYALMALAHTAIQTAENTLRNRVDYELRLVVRRLVLEKVVFSELGALQRSYVRAFNETVNPVLLEARISLDLYDTLYLFNFLIPNILRGSVAVMQTFSELLALPPPVNANNNTGIGSSASNANASLRAHRVVPGFSSQQQQQPQQGPAATAEVTTTVTADTPQSQSSSSSSSLLKSLQAQSQQPQVPAIQSPSHVLASPSQVPSPPQLASPAGELLPLRAGIWAAPATLIRPLVIGVLGEVVDSVRARYGRDARTTAAQATDAAMGQVLADAVDGLAEVQANNLQEHILSVMDRVSVADVSNAHGLRAAADRAVQNYASRGVFDLLSELWVTQSVMKEHGIDHEAYRKLALDVGAVTGTVRKLYNQCLQVKSVFESQTRLMTLLGMPSFQHEEDRHAWRKRLQLKHKTESRAESVPNRANDDADDCGNDDTIVDFKVLTIGRLNFAFPRMPTVTSDPDKADRNLAKEARKAHLYALSLDDSDGVDKITHNTDLPAADSESDTEPETEADNNKADNSIVDNTGSNNVTSSKRQRQRRRLALCINGIPPTSIASSPASSSLAQTPLQARSARRDPLEFRRGRAYAVMGANRSGKSTLVKIITRLIAPLPLDAISDARLIAATPENVACGTNATAAGDHLEFDSAFAPALSRYPLLLNGRPFASVPRRAWRRALSYVSQRPYLFPGTVEDNIRCGLRGKTRAEVALAAEMAGLLLSNNDNDNDGDDAGDNNHHNADNGQEASRMSDGSAAVSAGGANGVVTDDQSASSATAAKPYRPWEKRNLDTLTRAVGVLTSAAGLLTSKISTATDTVTTAIIGSAPQATTVNSKSPHTASVTRTNVGDAIMSSDDGISSSGGLLGWLDSKLLLSVPNFDTSATCVNPTDGDSVISQSNTAHSVQSYTIHGSSCTVKPTSTLFDPLVSMSSSATATANASYNQHNTDYSSSLLPSPTDELVTTARGTLRVAIDTWDLSATKAEAETDAEAGAEAEISPAADARVERLGIDCDAVATPTSSQRLNQHKYTVTPIKGFNISNAAHTEESTADPAFAFAHADLSKSTISRRAGRLLATPIAPNGSNISGGFAQSIALARVFLRTSAQIIILDEAFSQMDPRKVAFVVPNVARFAKQQNAMLLVVTHHIEPLKGYLDTVVEMEGGKVAKVVPAAEYTAPSGCT